MSTYLGGAVLPRDPTGRIRVTAVGVMVTLVAGLVALALMGTAPARADTYSVSIKNFSFNPQDLTIPAGSTVRWSNDESDGTVHSVTSDDGLFSQDLNPGDTFSWTFDKAGTYGVHCRFHTYITGTITVNDGSSSTTAPPDSTTSTTAEATTSTTAPEPTTSTTVPDSTTSTTAPDSTTSTTAPQSTTSTTAPESTSTTSTTTPPSTTSTTAPQDQTLLGGTVIPPVDGAVTSVFDAVHGALVAVDDALAGGS